MLAYEKVDKVMTREQLFADGADKFCDEISRGRNGLLETAHVVYDVRHDWFDAYQKLVRYIPNTDDKLTQKKALIAICIEMKGVIDRLYVYDQHDYVMKLLGTVCEDINNKISGHDESIRVQCSFVRKLEGKLRAKKEEYNEIIYQAQAQLEKILKLAPELEKIANGDVRDLTAYFIKNTQ